MIEIRKGSSNEYSFILKAESGHPLLTSVAYSNLETVENAVGSLQTIQKSRNTFERKTNHSGKFLFNLKNKSGELLGTSQLYQSEAGMENGIKNLITRINFLSKNQL